MKLIVIFGPSAVGKMTVGQELEKITKLKLFHNHMSLELVNQFFDFGAPSFSRLDKKIRFAIFEEVAKSELEGLIFTIVWAHNYKEDEDYINEIEAIFRKEGGSIQYVELISDLEVRLKRNRHEHRLKHKASKRNVEFSEKVMLSDEQEYTMNTEEGAYPDKTIFKIENTDLPAKEVAQMIKTKYDL